MTVGARWTLSSDGQKRAMGLTQLVLQLRGDRWEIVSDASM